MTKDGQSVDPTLMNRLFRGLLTYWRTIFVIAVLIAALPILQFARVAIPEAIAERVPFTGLPASIVNYSLKGFLIFFVGMLPFAAIELTLSAENRKALRTRYLLPLLIWAGYYVLSTIAMSVKYFVEEYTDISPVFSGLALPGWLHFLLYILLLDFCGYWFHRLEHANPFLWKFHATHHSLTELSAFNQYGHWLEDMFRFIVVYLPVSFILPTPELGASAVVVVWATWTYYVHSNAGELSLPRFARYILVDNLYHHYHHGRQRKYYDQNFAGLFSFWDVLFGTSHMPKDDRFPETGLEDLPPPTTLAEYATHSLFRPRRGGKE